MGRERYKVAVIKVTEDSHTHETIRTDNVPFTLKSSYEEIEKEEGKEDVLTVWETEVTYTVKDLYEVKSFFLIGMFRFFLTGIMNYYLIIVDKTGAPIKEETPAISGKVLKVSKDWKGLDQAINSAFSDRLKIGRIGLIVVIVIAIIALFLLVRSGWVPLPEGFLQ